MIKRNTYLEQLIALRDQKLIKVVTGIRRCGKSTLFELFRDVLKSNGIADENIHSYNFEERENQVFGSWMEIYDSIVSKCSENTNYVFLDEVQLVPQFEKLVDALFVKKNVDLYITGSNAYLLSGELATLLSGRYIAINLHPYSFAEYVSAFPMETRTDKLFHQYINGSCFPEAVNIMQTSPDMVNAYLRSLYDTIVVKDIVKRRKLRKFDSLQRIIDFVFDSVGSVVSPNNIADCLQKNANGFLTTQCKNY